MRVSGAMQGELNRPRAHAGLFSLPVRARTPTGRERAQYVHAYVHAHVHAHAHAHAHAHVLVYSTVTHEEGERGLHYSNDPPLRELHVKRMRPREADFGIRE